MTAAGSADLRMGIAAHVYLVTQSMIDAYFYDADGELLIVPQYGSLSFFTELGRLEISPGEICVIPRGIKFKVEPTNGSARVLSARIMGRLSCCRAAARSAQMAWLMRAILRRRQRILRIRRRPVS